MTKADSFDWSTLDRCLIAEMVALAGPVTINKSMPSTELVKKVRKLFGFFGIPVMVKTTYNKKTDLKSVWVGGLYDSVKDKKRQKSISILLQFHPDTSEIKIGHSSFRRMCYSIADTILHEVIHMRQYRRRNFKDIPGYESSASYGPQRTEQIYLGHNDEIDAYAFNIACQLMNRFDYDKKQVIQYLNSDLNDGRKKKDTFKMYLNVFDHDHDHTVIKKLKKKVVNYIPNATDIGKPYRTSDWLKK